jgi:hypothetical protein
VEQSNDVRDQRSTSFQSGRSILKSVHPEMTVDMRRSQLLGVWAIRDAASACI